MLNELKNSVIWQGANQVGLYGISKVKKDRFVVLTPQSKPLAGYIVKSRSILKGSPPFPTLYLFAMEEEEEAVEFPQQTTGYEFAAEAIIEIFHLRADSVHSSIWMQDIVEYIKTNKSALDKLRSRFNTMPRRVGAGSDGVVFSIGMDRVLKLFRDPSAYRAAVAAMHRVFKGHSMGAHEVLIDDVGQLGTFDSLPVYYYIMEKVIPADNALSFDGLNELQAVLVSIKEHLLKHRGEIERLRAIRRHVGNAMAYIGLAAQNISKSVRQTAHSSVAFIDNELGEHLRKDWLEKLVEEMLVKYMTNRTDLATRNIGWTNGKFMIYDAAFMETGSGREDMIAID